MKDKELPLNAVYTVVPCFFVCCGVIVYVIRRFIII